MTLGRKSSVFSALVFTAAVSTAFAEIEPDAAKQCSLCEVWNRPQEPFRVFGNTYYVGTRRLSSILIASGDGHMLLDGALPQSAPLIAANIEKLGFNIEGLEVIGNSHAHYDHAGGIAALQQASGARAVASVEGAKALELGTVTTDDPQFGFGRDANAFPPVAAVSRLADGESVPLPGLSVRAIYTPGHTPGSTSWTWTSCEDGRCLNVVYLDSISAVAAPGFRFSDRPALVARYRRNFDVIRALPCDILLSTHTEFFGMAAKLEAKSGGDNPFIDPGACKAYADAAEKQLDRRLARERDGEFE